MGCLGAAALLAGGEEEALHKWAARWEESAGCICWVRRAMKEKGRKEGNHGVRGDGDIMVRGILVRGNKR